MLHGSVRVLLPCRVEGATRSFDEIRACTLDRGCCCSNSERALQRARPFEHVFEPLLAEVASGLRCLAAGTYLQGPAPGTGKRQTRSAVLRAEGDVVLLRLPVARFEAVLAAAAPLAAVGVLEQLPFFHGWHRPPLAALAVLAEERAYADTELLIRQGDQANALYFLAEGKVKTMPRHHATAGTTGVPPPE